MYRFLDPKNDLVFKKVFGTEKHKDIPITFLNDICDGMQPKIEDIEFLKLDQNPEIAMLRQSIVDVLCRDKDGRSWIIEMQCARDSAFLKRAAAYACRVYLNQRTTEKSKGYGDMRPVIFIGVLDYILFPDKKDYRSYHEFRDVVTGENDIKDFSFLFLELGKFSKKFDEVKSTIEKWAYYFKNAPAVSPEELEIIMKDCPVIGSAYTALAEYGYTPEELLDYERYEMKADAITTGLEDAKYEGRREGLAEGEAKGLEKGKIEGKRETTKAMLKDGLSVSAVSKYSGLSEEEVLDLQKITQIINNLP